jgi:hypothetical protein
LWRLQTPEPTTGIDDIITSARKQLPELRFVIVAGPRIDRESLPGSPGVEIHGYVDDLHLRLAACDLALVVEQNVHVRHRLERYAAGRCPDYRLATPSDIAAAIVVDVGRPVAYRSVESDGDARAARLLSPLI